MHFQKLEVLWGKGTGMKGDVSAARFSSGLGALLTLCHLLCFPIQLPHGHQAETLHLIVALLSRIVLAKDHENIQESHLDLRWIKRCCLRLIMVSSFKANKKPEIDKYKAHSIMWVDAYYLNIMFHSLGTESPHNFQFLLSPWPPQKWFFSSLLNLLGALEGFRLLCLETVVVCLILKFPFPLFYK